ncbi:MAG: acyl-CoA/acyl-ACP dehydrogenase [Novosphingobium sp.]|nr:acyl-CoA/acyl-ACP dehydrogenase [Novosphingobium sp.]
MIERAELHDAAAKAFPASELRPQRDSGWQQIAELGWLLLPLPEDDGGLGLGRDSAAALQFELGKALATVPLLPALLSAGAIGRCLGLADKSGVIERAVSGEFVTCSLLPGYDVSSEGERLNGRMAGVPDADMASHVLVATGNVAALVPLTAGGVTATETPMWDETRRLFDISFDEVAIDPALILARGNAAAGLGESLQGELLIGLAADSLGGAEAVLAMTVDYLKQRRQFDRPLAMFQALKHRCADLKTQIAAAEALLWARAADNRATLADLGALKALACEVYRFTTEEAIQLHGGIGLTDEYPAHLFMKRAHLNIALGGDADHWREVAGRAALEALP